ncbi:MAG: hypothetical protein KAS87_06540, partial [Candidatus Omnitrophica bacterium]|nr:hypothetical protein [Candidatus Omnitrophota bacterium]
MPLQIEVQKGKITAGSGGNPGLTFTMTLICWNEGVTKEYPVRNPDGTIDMKNAVIFQDFTRYIKSNVEGKTTNQLVQEAATKVKVEMQTVI